MCVCVCVCVVRAHLLAGGVTAGPHLLGPCEGLCVPVTVPLSLVGVSASAGAEGGRLWPRGWQLPL